MRADSPRRGDLDGRGNQPRAALIELVSWFCQVAYDQVRFMSGLFDLDKLQERLSEYVHRELALPEHAAEIPIEVLRRGELARGQASRVTKTSERTARSALNALVSAGLLTSETIKSPVRLQFSVSSADALFPRLFGTAPVQRLSTAQHHPGTCGLPSGQTTAVSDVLLVFVPLELAHRRVSSNRACAVSR